MSDPLRERVVAALGDQYALEQEIGRGGMSAVYRAHDLRLNRVIAVKVLPPELAYDPAVRTRFTREAQTSAQLSHGHIVPIYDVGERDGIAYFVMSFITGGSLATLLAREPLQPIDEVRRILREVADALDYAHRHGVIHRDIKPDNILLDRDSGRALVTDFGIARAMEAGARLTVTGNAIGTPTYMSPEQATGERELDGRSDIYSLGVVAYQMVTGRLPFEAANSMALMFKHLNERPQPITRLRPEAPPALCEAIERALMKAPGDRWPTAASLRDALTMSLPQGAPWRTAYEEHRRPWVPSLAETREFRAVRAESRSGRVTGLGPESDSGLSRGERSSAAGLPGGIVLEPEHLAALTPAQREDLRLWHGRVNLRDRIKAARGYGWSTLAAIVGGFGLMAVGLGEEIPPFVLAPAVPIYMTRQLWLRCRSLRASGLKLRRVFLMPRARYVIPPPLVSAEAKALERLAPVEVLDGPQGAAIRRAVAERASIAEILAELSKEDRALIPDVAPTVDALVQRVAQLGEMLHRLEQSFDPMRLEEFESRLAEAARHGDSPEGERRLSLLRRQRDTMEELERRRASLVHQLESAGLALGNVRLDLIRLRSSGLQAALSDVSAATQEARALSRDIDAALSAVTDLRGV